MLDQNKTPDYYADAYVHQLLTQEEAAVVEERAESDKTWHHALEDARRRKQLLASVPPAEAISAQLPEQQRMVVTLRVWGGMSYAEIAVSAGRTEATIRSHMHRALESLRKSLTPVLMKD